MKEDKKQNMTTMTTMTATEKSTVTKDTNAAVKEQQLLRRARWMLNNFGKFLDQKHKQEEEMKSVPLFTREDALYKLSGMAAHQQRERVQTSNIANAPMSAAMNVDDMLERMNEEVVEEVSKGYDQLCERIRLVNVALAAMPVEVQHVAKQVYGRGVRKTEVIGIDGHVMGRTKVYELLQIAESIMAHSIQEDRALRNLRRSDEEGEDRYEAE